MDRSNRSLTKERTVAPEVFLRTVEANVDNEKLSDNQFRQFIRNSLPIVKYKKEER